MFPPVTPGAVITDPWSPLNFSGVNAQNYKQKYTVTLLGQPVTVTIEGSYTPDEFNMIRDNIKGAVNALNQAPLTAYQTQVIRNITGINVNSNNYQTRPDHVLRSDGTQVLRSRTVLLSATDAIDPGGPGGPDWLAGILAHEASHMEDFRLNGGVLSGQIHNVMKSENRAYIFQMGVGRKLGFSPEAINTINRIRTSRHNWLSQREKYGLPLDWPF
jgi:hypothetical protein